MLFLPEMYNGIELWQIYTLAQTGTGYIEQDGKQSAVIVSGTGTELINEKEIKGRAKCKMVTNQMTLSLIDVVEKK